MSMLALNTPQELLYYERLKEEYGYTPSQAIDIISCLRDEYANNMDNYPLKIDPDFLENVGEDAD